MIEALKSIDLDREKESEIVSTDKFDNLTKAIQAWINSWPAQSSNVDTLRASGLYYLCPREFVFNYWQSTPNRTFNWLSQIRMALGTYLHDYLQNYVLGPMGVLYGEWLCYTGGIGDSEWVEGFYPNLESAIIQISKGIPPSWHYEECKVWDENLRIAGHIDGKVSANKVQWILDNQKLFKDDPVEACNRLQSVEAGEFCLLEIKTTGKYQFEQLKSVDDIPDYYKMQACIYQHLSGVKTTIFWYIERDTLASKILVYEFERGWWNDVKRKARIVWESIRDEKLPDVGMACKLPNDKRARKCVFCTECFRGDFDFKKYVAKGKEKEDRKFLDLSDWKYEGE